MFLPLAAEAPLRARPARRTIRPSYFRPCGDPRLPPPARRIGGAGCGAESGPSVRPAADAAAAGLGQGGPACRRAVAGVPWRGLLL